MMHFNTQAEIDAYFEAEHARLDREWETIQAILLPAIAVLLGVFLGCLAFLVVIS